jgi:hypothetical protein
MIENRHIKLFVISSNMDGGSGMSKVVTMKEAIAAHVEDGDFLYIGGYICQTPFAAVRSDPTMTRSTFLTEIRQTKTNIL